MKLFNLVSKVLAVTAIFGGSSYVVISRYATETTTQTVTTTSSLGLLPTIFLISVIGVAIWFVSNQLSEMIKQSGFGWLAIIFFGLLLGLILLGVWFVFNSILISINTSVDGYIASMEYHKQTVIYMLYPIGAGVSLGFLTKLLEIDFVQKYLANLLK